MKTLQYRAIQYSEAMKDAIAGSQMAGYAYCIEHARNVEGLSIYAVNPCHDDAFDVVAIVRHNGDIVEFAKEGKNYA